MYPNHHRIEYYQEPGMDRPSYPPQFDSQQPLPFPEPQNRQFGFDDRHRGGDWYDPPPPHMDPPNISEGRRRSRSPQRRADRRDIGRGVPDRSRRERARQERQSPPRERQSSPPKRHSGNHRHHPEPNGPLRNFDDKGGRPVDRSRRSRSNPKHHAAINGKDDALRLPELDPSLNIMTVDIWIREIEETSKRNQWSERLMISNAKQKLAGVARHWYQSQNSFKSWEDFKGKLVKAFPPQENYAELLLEMLSLRAKPGMPLEAYYYEKMELINKCELRGKKAVHCLLHGIEDRAVRIGAQAARYSEPEHLLHYLKQISSI